MLLAVVCAVLTFQFPFYGGNVQVGQYGHEYRGLTAWPRFINGSVGSVLILIVTIVVVAGTLINIFNFKARSKQFWITIGLVVLSLLNIFLYWRATSHFLEGAYSLGALLSVAIPIFLFMAARGIRKDEKLVKSADRLR
jgi:hypothetical protein